jgi:hypothetical protein
MIPASSEPNTVSGARPVPAQPSAPFANLDIGSPQLAGSARPVETGWDLIAGGADIWEKADQFHFVFQVIPGDFDIAVRVESFTPAHLYSKAGLMIRESLNADSAHLMFLVFADNAPRNNNLGAYEMQFRLTAGADCQGIYPAVRPPAPPDFPAAFPNSWLRVARRGNRFSAFASTDEKSWKRYGEQVLPLADTVMVGPALTAHNPSVAAMAAFRDYIEFK